MLTLVVQAGGLSSRMGQDKGLVPLNGLPLIEHVLNRLDGIADEIIITSNHPENYQYLNHVIASDKVPGAGALTGLQTALQAANGDHVFVVACDMPLVNRQLVEYIVSQAHLADLIIPRFNDRYQPLHALYHREHCMSAVNRALAENQKRMISFHPYITLHDINENQIAPIDPSGQSFLNVNTQEELAQLQDSLKQELL